MNCQPLRTSLRQNLVAHVADRRAAHASPRATALLRARAHRSLPTPSQTNRADLSSTLSPRSTAFAVFHHDKRSTACFAIRLTFVRVSCETASGQSSSAPIRLDDEKQTRLTRGADCDCVNYPTVANLILKRQRVLVRLHQQRARILVVAHDAAGGA